MGLAKNPLLGYLYAHPMYRFILLIVVGFYMLLFVQQRWMSPSPEEQVPFFAETTDVETISAALKWYADHALGAMKPSSTESITLSEASAKGLITDASPRQVAKPYLATLWWSNEEELTFSPYDYEILSIDSILPIVEEGMPGLSVRFTWKRAEMSETAQRLQLSRTVDQTPEAHSLRFLQSKYGYILAIPPQRQPD